MKVMQKFMLALSVLLIALSVQAGTYTNYPTSTSTNDGLPASTMGKVAVLESSWTTDLTTGQSVNMIYIPKNTFVFGVGLFIDTFATAASGASLTIGDSSSATDWLGTTYVTNGASRSAWTTFAGTATWAGTGTNQAVTATANTTGKMYTTADYILVTVSGGPTNLDFTVKAVAVPLGK